MTVFDSSVWVALFDESDTLHKKARTEAAKVVFPIVIPEYIVIEVATVLLRKGGKKLADQFLRESLWNKEVHLITQTTAGMRALILFFLSHAHAKLSLVDTFLLHLSRAYSVITFDKNLAKAIAKR